jgi:hypothetical protein
MISDDNADDDDYDDYDDYDYDYDLSFIVQNLL